MKSSIALVFLFLVTQSQASTLDFDWQGVAGHEGGNGGGVVVCRTPEGKIQSIELLDLWEGKSLKGMNIPESPLNLREQVKNAEKKLQDSGFAFSKDIAFYIDRILTAVEQGTYTTLGADVAIAPPADAQTSYIKKGCSLEGMALYHDALELLEVDPALFSALSLTQTAATVVHEGIYRFLRRKFQVKDSILARHLTACAFSTDVCNEINPLSELPETGGYICTTKFNTLVAYLLPLGPCDPEDKFFNLRQGKFRIQILGYPTKTYVDVCIDPPLKNFASPDQTGERFLIYTTAITSESRWRNYGIHPRIVFGFDWFMGATDKTLRISNKELTCQAR